ncbi:MAG: biosynthetic-type acetolactate synthase large subunit [Desulfitobacterium sp.]
MRMSGARAVIECLKQEDVDIVFGYPGGAVLTLYDALYETQFPHILTRHEQGAVHAADGYARSTGKVGVCIATSGPGATNLITGIATAYMDSIPMVAITGQVAVSYIGRDSFQEADVTGITTPITKHNYLVKDVHDLARVFKEAFHIARTGRPGPVLIDIAKDVFAKEIDFHYPDTVDLRGYKPLFEGDSRVIAQVAEELAKAQRPLVFVGGGVNLADISPALSEFVEYTNIPVITSLMGLGCIPDRHPQNFGMVGMHGTYAANMATTHADLLIGLGVRFDDRVTGLVADFASKAKVIHFDIDPAEINKNIIANIRVVGDLKWSIPAMLTKVKERTADAWKALNPEWKAQLNEWREMNPLTYTPREGVVLPQQLIESVSQHADSDAVVVTDVGQHQMWASQFYEFRQPRTLLTSGGLGTMGYGLPAALGAQVGCPGRQILLFTGDGGFMMNCQELSALADLDLPVKVFILNNQVLGMVAQWQRMFYNGHYSHSTLKGHTDFVKLAEAMGVTGLRVTHPDEVEGAIQKALAIKGPVVVEVRIPEDENVLPMVPAGGRLDQMIMGG